MFDRFTERARRVLGMAHMEARRYRHDHVGTEHLLLGLVAEGTGVAAVVLGKMNIELATIRAQVEKSIEPGVAAIAASEQLPYTPRAKKALELALEEAQTLGHQYVGTEHLLLGLVREREGAAAQVLGSLGLALDDLRRQVISYLTPDSASPPKAQPPREGVAPATPSRYPGKRWEYTIIESKYVPGTGLVRGKGEEALGGHLNDLGEHGWEIIGVAVIETEGRQSFLALAKREKL